MVFDCIHRQTDPENLGGQIEPSQLDHPDKLNQEKVRSHRRTDIELFG